MGDKIVEEEGSSKGLFAWIKKPPVVGKLALVAAPIIASAAAYFYWWRPKQEPNTFWGKAKKFISNPDNGVLVGTGAVALGLGGFVACKKACSSKYEESWE